MAAPLIHCYETGTGNISTVVLNKPGSGSQVGPDGAKDPVAGDYLVVWLADDNVIESVWTAPDASWIQIPGGNCGSIASACQCTAFIKKVDGTEGVDFSFSNSLSTGVIGACILISGVTPHQASAIHEQGGETIDTLSPITISGLTTTVDDCLVFAIWTFDGGDSISFSVSGTGWTELLELRRSVTDTFESGGVAYKKMSGRGASGTCTVSSGSAQDSMAGTQFAIAPPPPPTFIDNGLAAVTRFRSWFHRRPRM